VVLMDEIAQHLEADRTLDRVGQVDEGENVGKDSVGAGEVGKNFFLVRGDHVAKFRGKDIPRALKAESAAVCPQSHTGYTNLFKQGGEGHTSPSTTLPGRGLGGGVAFRLSDNETAPGKTPGAEENPLLL
jgi:hypothetical protein